MQSHRGESNLVPTAPQSCAIIVIVITAFISGKPHEWWFDSIFIIFKLINFSHFSFLKPSQVRGIDTEEFIRQQRLASHIHENSVLGYRGLVGM